MADSALRSETEARVQLFWQDQLRAVESLPSDLSAFKNSELPLARIKKIMKLDEDVRGMMISAEVPLLFSKAAEMFIRELTLRAWSHTERGRRRTLQRNDIAVSVGDPDTDQFDFLIDIVPRDEIRPPHHHQHHHQHHQQQQQQQQQQRSPSEAKGPVHYVIQLPVGDCQPSGQAAHVCFYSPGALAGQQLVDVKPGVGQQSAGAYQLVPSAAEDFAV